MKTSARFALAVLLPVAGAAQARHASASAGIACAKSRGPVKRLPARRERGAHWVGEAPDDRSRSTGIATIDRNGRWIPTPAKAPPASTTPPR